MPKVKPFRDDYLGRVKQISLWVHSQMKKKHLHQADIGAIIDKPQQRVSAKLDVDNTSTWFNLIEMMKLFDAWETSDEEIAKLFK